MISNFYAVCWPQKWHNDQWICVSIENVNKLIGLECISPVWLMMITARRKILFTIWPSFTTYSTHTHNKKRVSFCLSKTVVECSEQQQQKLFKIIILRGTKEKVKITTIAFQLEKLVLNNQINDIEHTKFTCKSWKSVVKLTENFQLLLLKENYSARWQRYLIKNMHNLQWTKLFHLNSIRMQMKFWM